MKELDVSEVRMLFLGKTRQLSLIQRVALVIALLTCFFFDFSCAYPRPDIYDDLEVDWNNEPQLTKPAGKVT